MNLRAIGLALSLLSVPGTALAAVEADITLDHGSVWQTRDKDNTTQGFLQIHNTGTDSETLTGWSCPDADTTNLVGPDGKVLTSLTINAGETVTLAEKGVHFVLTSLHYPVQSGGILPCSLTFTNAGEVGGYLNAVPAPQRQ